MRYLGVIFTFLLALSLVSCTSAELPGVEATSKESLSPVTASPGSLSPEPGGNFFHSDHSFLTVQLPEWWALAEGPEYLAKPIEGQVAFNSWGQKDFWVHQAQSGNTYSYNPQIILSKVPAGGAYVALVRTLPQGVSYLMPHLNMP